MALTSGEAQPVVVKTGGGNLRSYRAQIIWTNCRKTCINPPRVSHRIPIQAPSLEGVFHSCGGTMRRRLVTCSSAAVVLAVMLCPAVNHARPGAPQPASPRAAASPAAPEAHPEIRAAIRALETAKHHLQSGAHDFGGHRAKALEHVNQALEECHAALQADKK